MGEQLGFQPTVYTPELRIFWDINDKGKTVIDDDAFITFLNAKGFYTYYSVKAPDNYKTIRIENNIIRVVDTRDIKEVALKYAREQGQNVVVNLLLQKTVMFSDRYLNALPTINPKIVKDTKDFAYIPTPTGVHKISASKVEFIQYSDLKDLYVWDTQITNVDFKYRPNADLKDSDFFRFCENLADGSSSALHSAIGYLLHNYKSPSQSKAVILYDKNLSFETGEPEGGSGKSLIATAIEKIREVAPISGDRVDFSRAFIFQELNESTQVAWVDELDAKADMSKFFSRITNGIPVEKKNKDVLFIKPEDSPKFVFTTNFKPAGSSGSHKRRRIEFAVSNHYNVNNTPRDEFSRDFFNDWPIGDEQWNLFFTFFANCLRDYLRGGIVEQHDTGSLFVSCAAEVGNDFAKFLLIDKELYKYINQGHTNARILHSAYLAENDLTVNEFSLKKYFSSLRKVCKLHSLIIEERGQRESKTINIYEEGKTILEGKELPSIPPASNEIAF